MTYTFKQTASGNLSSPKRVLVLGATGTIGAATVRELLKRRHEVVCFVRGGGIVARRNAEELLQATEVRTGDVTNPHWLAQACSGSGPFDALVSCMASRTGVPEDAWAIDYKAHADALAVAKDAGISQMVLLSAICVQRPQLPFQHAKLAFEKLLIESGLKYSIVRPTAFFKSLSGQIDRLKHGKPFVVFGDGRLTSCKPISDRDLACYMAECLENPQLHNRILPIGGPGDAITPKQQGEYLFTLLGREPRFRHVPVALLKATATGLGGLGLMIPALAKKAALARIGLYYATESMLVFDPKTGQFDQSATPSFGSETLFEHYSKLVEREISNDRGAHSVF
ncbi:MAG: NAD(P)H-binding protein [Pseudomonadota bacterium]